MVIKAEGAGRGGRGVLFTGTVLSVAAEQGLVDAHCFAKQTKKKPTQHFKRLGRGEEDREKR